MWTIFISGYKFCILKCKIHNIFYILGCAFWNTNFIFWILHFRLKKKKEKLLKKRKKIFVVHNIEIKQKGWKIETHLHNVVNSYHQSTLGIGNLESPLTTTSKTPLHTDNSLVFSLPKIINVGNVQYFQNYGVHVENMGVERNCLVQYSNSKQLKKKNSYFSLKKIFLIKLRK